MNRLKKPIFAVLMALFTVGVCEFLARAAGLRPRIPFSPPAGAPVLYEPDPDLGWVKVPGSYTVPAPANWNPPLKVTFWSGNQRATAAKPIPPMNGNVAIFGGSFTEGSAISDEESYAWKIQSAFPDLAVHNYGTGGWGTYQSFLQLERSIPELSELKVVMYGLIEEHETRNVANSGWLDITYSPRVPFTTLNDQDELVRHPPTSYPVWPLQDRLACVAALTKVYMKMVCMERFRQRREVLNRLLLEMRDRCAEQGAQFMVALLKCDDKNKAEYIQLLDRAHIPYVDCVIPMTYDLKVPKDGHPNDKLTSLWVERMIPAIRANLSRR